MGGLGALLLPTNPGQWKVLVGEPDLVPIVCSQLVRRFPTLRSAVGGEELRMRHDVLTGGLVELPVRW